MKRLKTRRGVSLFAVMAVGVLAAGGIAYATIPSTSDGVIHGCYDRTGSLRVIDVEAGQACKRSSEQPISWNAQGPPGPSNTYADEFCTSAVHPSCAGTPPPEISATSEGAAAFFLTLANLPPGAYAVTAAIRIGGSTTGDWNVNCFLRTPLTGPGFATGAWATVGDNPGHVLVTTIPLVLGTNLPSGGAAGLKCWKVSGAGTNPTIDYALITAVKVEDARLDY
jgi:hypothetical protein